MTPSLNPLLKAERLIDPVALSKPHQLDWQTARGVCAAQTLRMRLDSVVQVASASRVQGSVRASENVGVSSHAPSVRLPIEERWTGSQGMWMVRVERSYVEEQYVSTRFARSTTGDAARRFT